MKKQILVVLLSILLLTGNAYGADQWDKTKFADTTLIPDAPGLMRVNNEAIDRILVDYQEGADVFYSSAIAVTVSPGSVACSNSGGTIRRLRTNTSTTSVGWANIDAGAEEASTTYNVFAVADTDATTFTVMISKSSAPTGATYYKKLGSFYNDASSNIDRAKIYTNTYGHTVNDNSGIPEIVSVYDYGTSTSSYTVKESAMKIAFGNVADDSTVSNLPFTSTGSYAIVATMESGIISQNVRISGKSATGFTIGDGLGNGLTINWIAVGY